MKKGFTLLEIMIAIGILMTVSYLSYMTMDGMFELKEEIKKEQEYSQMVMRVIQRIKREISNSYILSSNKEDAKYKTIFKTEREFDVDKITFTSFSHLRMHFNAKESDQAEISYFGRKREDGVGYDLMRREDVTIDDKPEKGGVIRKIGERIKQFRCEYYKESSEEWVEEWNTDGIETGRTLPPFIKCKIVFYGPTYDEDSDPREESYLFSIKLHLKEPL